MSESLDSALAKIRPHTSSNLPHQKAPATLLHALEATFEEQKSDKSPTAYFAALLTTLEGTLQKTTPSGPALGDGDLLPAELYLLALVAPFTPQAVIRAHLNTILSLASPLFPSLNKYAPPLRSQLGLYEVVLKALDRSQLEIQAVRQSFASILQLCLDPRPKVRKRAAEVVKAVLSSPPSPLVRHPYAERVAEWVKSILNDVNVNALPKSKAQRADVESGEIGIHLLAFLRPVLFKLPPSSLPSIVPLLLSLPRLGNPYLSQTSYSILSELLSVPEDGLEVDISDEIPDILKAVLSSPPPKTDATLAPAWLGVLGNTMVAFKSADADALASHLGKAWKAMWSFLESNDLSIRNAAAESLALLAQCFTPTFVAPALKEKRKTSDTGEPNTQLNKIILQTDKALELLAFARSMPQLLAVISSLLSNLRYRESPTSSTAAEILLLQLVQKIGELRLQKDFEHKESVDATLGTAMSVMGPEVLLKVLPLNLEPSDRLAGREPRAFILPLLTHPHPSPLSHFISYFVPLTERMFELHQKADTDGRQAEAKVWTVLIAQIWTGLPSYCWAPVDLRKSLDAAFSQLLSGLLYNQPELRPPILKALKTLVESNKTLASADQNFIAKYPALNRPDTISTEEAALNLDFLRGQAESWLAVLFNVFGSVNREARGMVGDVISAWAGIASEQATSQAFRKVVNLFKTNVAKQQPTKGPDGGSVIAMTQDIILLLLPYLSAGDCTSLFQLCLTPEVVCNPDNGVQKRGYKTLAKLVESGKLTHLDVNAVVKKLDQLSDGLAPAAKKDRFYLYANILPNILSTGLHVIPSLLPEAVLGTKEPSEKARNAAFDLLVAMARKMNEGGLVKRNLVDGMDDSVEGGSTEAKASLEEFLTMLAGGLAGATPHMISASITAISRVVFEFKESISSTMHTEIFTTILVFLTSANREIVKSTLGFLKLSIHTLPVDLIRPHLPQLVPALLGWSHDHKNHFKAKVRHIFERMLRRFQWEEIYGCVEGEEAAKMLVNIKKRKERAKKKRAAAAEDGDDDEQPTVKPVTGDAFEDVLYGSESELDDSDEEGDGTQRPSAATGKQRKTPDYGARLRVDDDEPMDLLSGAASRITNAQSSRRRKPGQDAARFKTEEDTGKMIIDDNSDSDADADGAAGARGEDVEGTAYREAMTSVDGFTRGPNGRIKFNKDTKKRRRENKEDGDGDVEMVDVDAAGKGGKERPAKKRTDEKLGKEFKAKKAGGDVKKGGMDPYAYLPLAQAAKKGGKRNRLGVAGKR